MSIVETELKNSVKIKTVLRGNHGFSFSKQTSKVLEKIVVFFLILILGFRQFLRDDR
jgi:hypothetical protein